MKNNTFKGTPGPWHVSQNNKDQVRADINIPVARIHSMLTPAEIKANARLIAAAPDLLDACNEAIQYVSCEEPAYDKIKAAINKALGNE